MAFHLGIFVSVCLIALLGGSSGSDDLDRKRASVLICTFILGTILALRTWWMADMIKYHTQYVTIAGQTIRELMQEDFANLGLRTLFVLEYKLTGGIFQIVIILESYFCMGCLGYIIYKYSPLPVWSYFSYMAVGLYFFNFSGMKQSIAMAFLLLSFDGIARRQPIKFAVLVFLAGMFHAPAFIGIIAYYFANWRITRNYFLTLLFAFIVVLVFRTQLVSLLSDLYYEDTEIKAASGVGGKFLIILTLLIGGALLRPPFNKDAVYAKVYNLMVFAALLQSFSIFGHNFTRLADYYFQFITLYLPFIMQHPDQKDIADNQLAVPYLSFTENSYVLAGLFLFVLGFYYYSIYIRTDISGILDYKCFWQVSQTPWGS